MKKILLSVILLLTACSDPSPLKSDTEVKINQLFGTKFGLVDQIYIKAGDKTLTVMNPVELLAFLEDAEQVKAEEKPGDIKIILKTSEGMKEYSKEQTSEELSFDTEQDVLCNENLCYKLGESFSEMIESF
ncbi:hypothetical protein [Mesobacillus subterraneus]|uniref:Lipoprotein n=1 Tax=Mesobacillus subterraneus TaxID=285983 RepID=A0A427TZC7_9BACI|nr:hypothetical protein [Mesobacillus subterraneus]RSD29600.1 hypothetical protein EJA10_00375 [Mesobacillus subterraneus]